MEFVYDDNEIRLGMFGRMPRQEFDEMMRLLDAGDEAAANRIAKPYGFEVSRPPEEPKRERRPKPRNRAERRARRGGR